jgi:glycine cleavage system H protein
MNQLIKTSKFLKRFPLSRNFSCSFFALKRKYTEDHEWVELTGNICKFGITDYAQKALGDVVYIEVPSVGDQVAQKGKNLC